MNELVGKAEEVKNKLVKLTAEKKALEDARFILPNACTTKMIVTMKHIQLRKLIKNIKTQFLL